MLNAHLCLATKKRYYEARGRQLFQLSSSEDIFSKEGKLRWVNDLTVVYGDETKPRYEDMLCVDPVHDIIRRIGICLKLMNGYWNGFDESKYHTLTPDTTNFLVPYISFIIEWNKDEEPECTAGGLLSFSQDKKAVFVSGGGQNTPLDILSNTYNLIMKLKDQHPVELIAGDKISTWCDIEQIRKVPINPDHPLKEEK